MSRDIRITRIKLTQLAHAVRDLGLEERLGVDLDWDWIEAHETGEAVHE
jgi:hypothetical protein